MTATQPQTHPLLIPHVTSVTSRRTESGRLVGWSARMAFTGGKGRGVMRRITGKLVAVTWRGTMYDAFDTRTLTVETAGTVTVFTLSDSGGPGGSTRHLDSFTCPADVNALFLTAIDPKDPFAAPLADYLMERECPADILAFFW